MRQTVIFECCREVPQVVAVCLGAISFLLSFCIKSLYVYSERSFIPPLLIVYGLPHGLVFRLRTRLPVLPILNQASNTMD